MNTLGQKIDYGTWVQTERKAHEAWAAMIARKPRAAQLAHLLVANMGVQNAVVVPQKLLAQLMGCSIDTVQRAIRDLVKEEWIQVVKLNGPGTVAAYVVNDQVAWGQARNQLRTSVFSATVIADYADQDPDALATLALRKIPVLFPHERQLPTGPGEAPPSQPSIAGMEPDLPALARAEFPDPWEDWRQPSPAQQEALARERGRLLARGEELLQREKQARPAEPDDLNSSP